MSYSIYIKILCCFKHSIVLYNLYLYKTNSALIVEKYECMHIAHQPPGVPFTNMDEL